VDHPGPVPERSVALVLGLERLADALSLVGQSNRQGRRVQGRLDPLSTTPNPGRYGPRMIF